MILLLHGLWQANSVQCQCRSDQQREQEGWLSPISLRHVLTSPGYAPGTIAVNVTWMKKRIQFLSKASQNVPIYLQPFPSNSTHKFKSSPFQHIFALFGLPWVRPWENRGKCYMDGKRSQCWSQQHIPIYLPFTSYSEILVGNCNFFLPPCIYWGCSHWKSGKKFGPQKTRIMGLRGSEDRLSRFDTIPACDRWTDRRPAYSYNVHSMTDAC